MSGSGRRRCRKRSWTQRSSMGLPDGSRNRRSSGRAWRSSSAARTSRTSRSAVPSGARTRSGSESLAEQLRNAERTGRIGTAKVIRVKRFRPALSPRDGSRSTKTDKGASCSGRKARELTDKFLESWPIDGRDLRTVREHLFHSERDWRFDLAFPDQRVAVEFEGAIGKKSRHTTWSGYHGDCDKYNAAQALGWVVLRFGPDHLRRARLAETIDFIRGVLISRSNSNGSSS